MKRAILLGTILLCALPQLFADYSEYQWYGSALIGFWMPPDTEVEEEDGTWYAYSDSHDLLVIFEEADQQVAAADISEASLFMFDEVYELDDFKVIDVIHGDVSYAYGQGIYTDEDGDKSKVIFGILTGYHWPHRTFIFSIMSSNPDSPATAKAIKAMLKSIIPSPAG